MKVLAVLCVFLALAAGLGGLALGLYGLDQASQNSVSLRREVGQLKALQAFDHQQITGRQKLLQSTVVSIEEHLDRTIQRAIGQAAQKVAREFVKPGA